MGHSKEGFLDGVIVEDGSSEEGEFRPDQCSLGERLSNAHCEASCYLGERLSDAHCEASFSLGERLSVAQDEASSPAAQLKEIPSFGDSLCNAKQGLKENKSMDVVGLNYGSEASKFPCEDAHLGREILGGRDIQGYIHTCEAVHLGRQIIEETKRVRNNDEPLINSEKSAVPYVKSVIETKVHDDWKAQLNKVTTGVDFVFPSIKHIAKVDSQVVGKDVIIDNPFGTLDGLVNIKVDEVVQLAHSSEDSKLSAGTEDLSRLESTNIEVAQNLEASPVGVEQVITEAFAKGEEPIVEVAKDSMDGSKSVVKSTENQHEQPLVQEQETTTQDLDTNIG